MKTTSKGIFLILAAALGTFLSRWHGGGFFYSPKILKNFMWALPFSLCTALIYQQTDKELKIVILAALAVLASCMLGKATGHGGGMDLAHSPKEPGAGRTPEKVEYLILFLHGHLHRYVYDALILFLAGIAAVLGAAIMIGLINPLAGVLVAIGGACKPLGYILGWLTYPDGDGRGWKEFNEATAIGEGFTGAIAYAALAFATMGVLL